MSTCAGVGPAEAEATVAFTVWTRGSFGSGVSLHRALTVALADARVHGLRDVVVDDRLPPYRPLAQWRATTGKDVAGGAMLVFTDAGDAYARSRAALALGHEVRVDRVDPLTARLRVATRTAEAATQRGPWAGAVAVVSVVVFLVAFVKTQLYASMDPTVPGAGAYLWRGRSVLVVLATCLFLCDVLAIACLLADGRARRRLALVAGPTVSVTAGVLFGGIPRDLFSLQTLGILAGFAGVWLLWDLARLPRLGLLTVVLRVSTVIAVVIAFGRWRMILYFAGMGLSSADVDTSTVDAFVTGFRSLAEAALLVAALGALAWFASGQTFRPLGIALTIVAIAVGAAQILGTLNQDEIRGRLVGTGTARLTAPGLRLDPGPIAMCVTAVGTALRPEGESPLLGDLPLLVWKVATLGQQTLLLDPANAKALYFATLPGGTAVDRLPRPEHNIAAQILYLPSNQLSLRRAETSC